MTQKDSFPGPLQAAGLVFAMWLAQIALGFAVHAAGIGISTPGALVWTAVASEVVVVMAFLSRRRIGLATVLHPSPSSKTATTGLVAPAILLIAPLVFIAVCFADDAVREVFPMSADERQDFERLLSGGSLTAAAMVVVGPMAEEMLFRGIILRGFLARMPASRAVLVSSLLFGIAHLNVYQLVSATLIGIPIGWLYVRFRSVLPGFFLHAALNGLSVIIGNLTRADVATAELPAWFLLASAAAFVPGAYLLASLTRLRQSQA